jgi:hypothetical protein
MTQWDKYRMWRRVMNAVAVGAIAATEERAMNEQEQEQQGGYLLTSAEKRRLSQWLLMQIESSQAMIKQMETLPHTAPFVQKEKIEVAAHQVVYRIINSGEEMTIGN